MNNVLFPVVSVITVTYNSASFVRDTIESVLAQDYTNLQYIISDDCSTDNTWSIINEYSDPRIVSFRNNTNLGEYPNRNKALAYVTGKYVIFIDGDDIIYPHGIGFFVKMMELFPEASLAIQKGYLNNLLYPALLYPEESITNYYFGKQNLLSSSFASDFYRTNALQHAGLLSENYVGGDNQIRLKVASKHPVLLVAGWVSWPRETPGQASSRMTVETHLTENLDIACELDQQNDPGIINPVVWRDIIRSNKRSLARHVLKCIISGKFHLANSIKKKSKLGWLTVFTTAYYKPKGLDFLSSYTSDRPFKRGFIA